MKPDEYSDLRILARMDISVLWLQNEERYEYYVNEVTDGHWAVLFLELCDAWSDAFHSELARALGTRVLLKKMNCLRMEAL